MSEKTTWTWLRTHVFRHPDRAQRMENLVGDGFFDTNYCIDGVEGWIEIKSPLEPVRQSTRLFGSNHPVLRSQMNWAKMQLAAKGRCFFFIHTNKRKMLVHGKYADRINDMTTSQLIDVSDWHDNQRIVDIMSISGLRGILRDPVK